LDFTTFDCFQALHGCALLVLALVLFSPCCKELCSVAVCASSKPAQFTELLAEYLLVQILLVFKFFEYIKKLITLFMSFGELKSGSYVDAWMRQNLLLFLLPAICTQLTF